jgi:SAM-dependent methyltransferase
MTELGFDPARFKSSDRDSYNLVAEAWDRHSSKTSGPFVAQLLEMAGVGPGQRAIEVCCGTGVASRAAALLVGPGGCVLGTDLTPGMVEVARARARTSGLGQAEFRVMDCEALEVDDASFDVGFALYPHFRDHRRALAELYRVLRPGGRVSLGVGGGGPGGTPSLAGQLMQEIVTRYQPDDPGGHPPNWAGPEPSVGLPRALAEAGFTALATDARRHDVTLAGPEEWWDIRSMSITPVRHRLARLSPARRDAARQEFLAAFAPRANAETLTIRLGATYVSGMKPDHA